MALDHRWPQLAKPKPGAIPQLNALLKGGGGTQCGVAFGVAFVAVLLILALLRPPMVRRKSKSSYEVRAVCTIRILAWSLLTAVVATIVTAVC